MNKAQNKKNIIENTIIWLFFTCAAVSVLSVLSIIVFLCLEGFPAFKAIGIFNFVLGQKWMPETYYGIFPMLIGSIYATIGAVIFGVPIGLLTAIFVSEIAPDKIVKVMYPTIELLAGIPSVIYGFWGLMVIVPWISNSFGGYGNSLLAVSIVLGIMILPTVITVSAQAIQAVPTKYKEASLSLGASHIRTIFKVILPTAKSGVVTAIILGMGRAIGETMAVMLISGNVPLVPNSVLSPLRTLTSNIAIEMGYAFGIHRNALFATGVVLLVFISILYGVVGILNSRVEKQVKG